MKSINKSHRLKSTLKWIVINLISLMCIAFSIYGNFQDKHIKNILKINDLKDSLSFKSENNQRIRGKLDSLYSLKLNFLNDTIESLDPRNQELANNLLSKIGDSTISTKFYQIISSIESLKSTQPVIINHGTNRQVIIKSKKITDKDKVRIKGNIDKLSGELTGIMKGYINKFISMDAEQISELRKSMNILNFTLESLKKDGIWKQ